MKKKRFYSALTLLIIASFLIVTMNNCRKTNEYPVDMENLTDQTALIEKSKAMQEHVLAFKTKMEYYWDNPNLKTGGELYTADSAVLEIESLLNYDFCYTDIECTQKTFELSEVAMPLDEIEKINDLDLMQVYYDKIIDTLQAQMGRVNYSNMKLLLVDLEKTGTDSNGDAIVSVGALIGNEEPLNSPSSSETGWHYGFQVGNCDGSGNPFEGVWDAALELQITIHGSLWTAPPPGFIRRFDVVYTKEIIYPNVPEYRTDDDVEDNYLDYDIFYATNSLSGYPITSDTRCVSSDIEIPHYINSYNSIIADVRENKSIELGVTLSYINNIIEANTNYNEDYIKHLFMFQLGETWLVPVGSLEIENILMH